VKQLESVASFEKKLKSIVERIVIISFGEPPPMSTSSLTTSRAMGGGRGALGTFDTVLFVVVVD
jgi:hypothetical protein